ncbi:MAG TPA: cytochrome c biogenesis protein CcsA [Bacteroidota bacterium]|nr:cytochrome c biogenesis protein CcsA [Bacteroidota bacterium]
MIGSVLIYLAMAATIASIISYFMAEKDGAQSFISPARIGVLIAGASIVAASALLMTAILSHDFSYAYVFGYSSRGLALHFLISSFYAGQEGSFLFWTLCSVLLSFVLLASLKKKSHEGAVMIVFLATQLFLLVLLSAKSPFQSIWDAFPGQLSAGQLPQDGKGLNPLLQNFWMVIHPPVLFIGFALTAVPFSFAIAALWKKNYTQWIVNALPWSIAAAVLLGLGIMLGAYWAYGILGWGGYWGWDPVENSSLIPWLLLMALVHTMLVQLRTQKLPRTNFSLAVASFVLVVYSTFLTRSGVLGESSVHSFTDPGRLIYALLLAFVIAFALLGVGFILYRNKELSTAGEPMKFLSREFVLFAGSFLLLIVAAVVFFGTNVPLLSSVRVEPTFYDTTSLPFAAVMTLFIGLSLMIRWKEDEYKIVAEKSVKSFAAAVVLTAVIAYSAAMTSIPVILLVFASCFTIAVNLEITIMTVQGNWRMLGGKIAHIGVGLFFLGVILNGVLKEKDTFSLPMNTPVQIFGHTATFTGHRQIEGQKTAFDVQVSHEGREFTLSPVMFQTEMSGLMRTPDLYSYFTRDFYISPVSIEESQSGPTSTIGETVTLAKGKTGPLAGAAVHFTGFEMDSHAMGSPTGASVGTALEITKGKETERIVPAISYDQTGVPKYKTAFSKLLGSNVQLLEMHIGQGGDESQIVVGLVQPGGAAQPEMTPVLIVEASVHPYILLLWIGTVLLFVGMIIAYARRKNEETILNV